MRVLVTGAAGFVGHHVGSALAKAGHEVVAVTRSALDAPWVGENRVVSDLSVNSDWSILDGSQAVVHVAAHVHRMRVTEDDLIRFRTVNVDVTKRLAEAAAQKGMERFVLISTAKVLGESSGNGVFDETSAVAPADPYALSKADSESALRRSGVSFTILRPPLVYGPGVRANFFHLLAAVARRRILPLGSISNSRSLISVSNLADAVRECLTKPAADGKTYLVSDGEDVSTPELVRRMGSALEVSPRLVALPQVVIRLGAAIVGRAEAAQRLTDSLRVDGSRIRNELGWEPPISLDAGLKETARWYRSLT